ncbi:MAG: riboflavin biosynthesis protein RibF [Candidatus Lambdaproteobacteria bacterium RIFOXYD1_FULL_56_27]|uniref:Riboflavin biosynthesis protein n=1 Tax=Candidatus Lambdaproteobacteria bacterium RIFOXYD2_FULL_56_26 TaxID=1817773 RepID=A0A1F6H1L4_9PROT|nr:MAG: riboflavin biosynthesis protein RibF [Candidatus Lambdaproteobacteria bacterium RIFOXYD2_FULL_56_26]OGH05706.1 MAG: riboflavin biosynthesis protein RibF [Candidatus Lambdaproteobacteria bacterium RIFOXYC1_FULL_56_13]OGH08427.1 MAG: riboflavin biosynthesis protein RibF [Candidatus Lambdaproteobacteria bacterium RIFOXYD1_FULL_56_27]
MDLLYRPFSTEPLTGHWSLLIGNFDGFHLGHQALVARLREEQQRLGTHSALLTFDPHPKEVLQPEVPFYQIYQNPTKWRLFAEAGVDACWIAPFTHAFASLSAAEFLDRLFGHISLKKILVGYDFNFGKSREGSAHLLEMECQRRGVEFEVLGPVKHQGITVSSSLIRNLLFEGEFDRAQEFLGRRFAIEGPVTPGHRKGHQLGFPTLNLPTSGLLPLKLGVYGVEVAYNGKLYPGVCNIGFKPTFEGQNLITEAHLFNFDQEIYGQFVQVFPVVFLRDEERFPSLEALSNQIAQDVAQARQYFGL